MREDILIVPCLPWNSLDPYANLQRQHPQEQHGAPEKSGILSRYTCARFPLYSKQSIQEMCVCLKASNVCVLDIGWIGGPLCT